MKKGIAIFAMPMGLMFFATDHRVLDGMFPEYFFPVPFPIRGGLREPPSQKGGVDTGLQNTES
jgi:hypothetical protein